MTRGRRRCSLLSLAVPVAEAFRGSMTAPQQALLTSAEQAVSDCAGGNATAAVIDIATAIQNYLTSKNISRAMLMSRAGVR